MSEQSPEQSVRNGSWAFELALSLLGPIFFLSYFLTLISPLPILYLYLGSPNTQKGRFWAFLASIFGFGIVLVIKGPWTAFAFFGIAALTALVLGELLLRNVRLEKAVLASLTLQTLLAAGILFFFLRGDKVSLHEAVATLENHVRETATSIHDTYKAELAESTAKELQTIAAEPKTVLREIPGFFLSGLLLLNTLSCIALVRWNPKGLLRRAQIPRDFLRKWKAPEWLVWVALLCGAFLIFEVKYVSFFAENLLKPIVLIYFFQGMSILSFFLDSLRLRGPVRVLFYCTGILFLTPMIVSFGFFDLWFNFRRRQKDIEKEPEP